MHATSQPLTWMCECSSDQRARNPDHKILCNCQRNVVVTVIAVVALFLIESSFLEKIHCRKGSNHKRNIPSHRWTPRAVKPSNAFGFVNGGNRRPKARVDPRHQSLFDDFLGDRHQTGTRRPQCRRYQGATGVASGSKNAKLDGSNQDRKRAGGETATHQGFGTHIREGSSVTGLCEGPKGVQGIENRLGDPAAASARR